MRPSMSCYLFPDRRKLLAGAALTAPAIISPKQILAAFSSLSHFAESNGPFQAPYSAQSLWKARPVNPTLGAGVIASNQYAYVPYNAPIYYARASDPPVTIINVGVSDEITTRNVILPHFPAGVDLPPGTDKEVVIYDTTTQLLHSFWCLDHREGGWAASQYNVESATGWGWGTPSRPGQVRASGCSPAAGVLRNWELPTYDNADAYPQHALAMGLGANSILADSVSSGGSIYPATDQDEGFRYTGALPNAWPMGTLFMLPSSFDLSALSAPGAIAIAKTLMKYGAYLVDASPNTCGFYCEWSPSSIGWPSISYGLNGNNADFTAIRDALRSVTAVESWLDGNGNPWVPPPWASMNLLSMRGPWIAISGTANGSFDTAANFFVAPRIGLPSVMRRVIYQPCNYSSKGWWWNWYDSSGWFIAPTPGRKYTLSIIGSGAVTASLSIWDPTISINYFASSVSGPGHQQTFTWPNQSSFATLLEVRNPGAAGQIRLELVAARRS
jgi:hypothetical protein